MAADFRPLSAADFDTDPVSCAIALIGCELRWNGCRGRIVETEAYAGENDEACHLWFRPSARAFVAKHKPGDAYVYLNYGIHRMLNFLVGGAAGGFVLVRAIEPLSGLDLMRARRPPHTPDKLLAAGPGRLAQAFGIDLDLHGSNMLAPPVPALWLSVSAPPPELLVGPRIGISKAIELPWRFGLAGSVHLSRPFPKAAGGGTDT